MSRKAKSSAFKWKSGQCEFKKRAHQDRKGYQQATKSTSQKSSQGDRKGKDQLLPEISVQPIGNADPIKTTKCSKRKPKSVATNEKMVHEGKVDQIALDSPNSDVMVVNVSRKARAQPTPKISHSTSSFGNSDDVNVKSNDCIYRRTTKKTAADGFARPTLAAKAKQVSQSSRPTSSSQRSTPKTRTKKRSPRLVAVTGRRLPTTNKKRELDVLSANTRSKKNLFF